jgi:arabinofuranan 3-O-arabinosyltransferase
MIGDLPSHEPSWQTRAALFFWPISALTALHQVRDTLVTSPGGDFIPVWRAARAFVNGSEPYRVDGFVYPPSAVLLFAPFGRLTFGHAHLLVHLLNATCLLAAAVVALRLFRIRLSSPVAAAIVFALFISAPGRLTLYLDNVDGLVLATGMFAFLAAVEGWPTAAGTLFGLGLAIKPVLLPLVVLPLLAKQWRMIAAAGVVPFARCLLVLPVLPGAASFVTDVLPFLWKGNYPQNYTINTSFVGAVTILQLAGSLATVLRLVTLSIGVVLFVADFLHPVDGLPSSRS